MYRASKKLSYFRTTVNEDWDHSLEMKYRIERARDAF